MFYDSLKFPFLKGLEKNSKKIEEEYHSIPKNEFKEWIERNHVGTWEIFLLYVNGKVNSVSKIYCPFTLQIVKNVPGILRAGFSLLSPGTVINPHEGHSRRYLRCHLGVEIPDHCGLQVGNEIRSWKNGEVLVFDDRSTHSSWNKSTSPRTVLIVDFLRPKEFYFSDYENEPELNDDGNLEYFIKKENVQLQ